MVCSYGDMYTLFFFGGFLKKNIQHRGIYAYDMDIRELERGFDIVHRSIQHQDIFLLEGEFCAQDSELIYFYGYIG